jgi:hypothetical protein
MSTSQQHTHKPANPPQVQNKKKRSFDMVLTAIKMDLMRDFEFYQEALRAAIHMRSWGGDATAW